VPPHQAVWVPPGVKHDVEVPVRAAMRRLYVKPPFTRRLPATQTLDRAKRSERNVMELLLDELLFAFRRTIGTTPGRYFDRTSEGEL